MQRRQLEVETKEIVKTVKVDKLEGKSLYMFAPDNKYRKRSYNLAKNNYFEAFIIITILVSTTSLSIQSPLEDP